MLYPKEENLRRGHAQFGRPPIPARLPASRRGRFCSFSFATC